MANSKNVLSCDDGSVIKNGKEINSAEPKFEIFPGDQIDTELDRIKRIIRNEISSVAQEHGMESFEEANDFDIEDSFDMDDTESRYMKEEFLQVPPHEEVVQAAPQGGLQPTPEGHLPTSPLTNQTDEGGQAEGLEGEARDAVLSRTKVEGSQPK
jgi:hypothetical protein